MSFFEYFSFVHLLNLSLLGVVFLLWLITNRWVNKNLEKFLKSRGWLVEGREKNIKKLIKQILLLVSAVLALECLTIGNDTFSVANITHFELFGFDIGEIKKDGSYDRFSFTVGSVFYLLFIIITSRIAISIFRVLIYRSTRGKKWIDEGGTYTVVQLSKYLTYTIAVIVAIQGVGINISSFSNVFAAAILGISLGIQYLLSDVFSGIVLLFDGSIKVGDVVEMNNHEICKVEHIFIRTSQLKTLDGKIIIVPNTKLTKENVTNWSISDRVTRFNIDNFPCFFSPEKHFKF